MRSAARGGPIVTDVLVVDGEALVSIGIKMILESTGGFAVATTDRENLRSAVEQHRPAVVLLDGHSAQSDGLEVLDQLRALSSPPAIAMLTTLAPPELVLDSLRGGACGFLLRDSQPEQLVAAVRALAEGSIVLAPEASSVVVRAGSRGSAAGAGSPACERVKQLSDREQSILRLLGAGLTNAEISRQLFLSAATVKEHVSVILSKLGVANRVQAAVLAYASGLSSDDVCLS
uniref:Response regulator n=1 Tax=Actinoplanes garbadinensis TaxID=69485 RepID=C4NFI3_ACTGA|nr:response regulator [Actinoplanes garbadinensis]